jgi:hypothetical protein
VLFRSLVRDVHPFNPHIKLVHAIFKKKFTQLTLIVEINFYYNHNLK